MSDLPPGWREAQLGDVCQVVSGSTPKTGVEEYWGGDIPWMTPDDLAKRPAMFVHGGRRFLTQAGYDSCSTRLVPAGSVLYSSRAPIGYAAIATQPVCTNQGFKTAVPDARLDARFLYWQLLALTDSIRARASGTTFKEISGKAFAATRLVVPPLDEQHRIVAVLEDHLSRLDAAHAYLLAAKARTEALLRSCELDLLDRAAPAARVNDVVETSIGGVWGAGPGEDEVDVAVLRVTELRARGRIDSTTAARRSITRKQLDSRQLQAGDLLLEKSGGGPRTPVGRVGLVEDAPEGMIFANFMQLLRPDRARVRPRYLHAVLNALHSSGRTAHLQTASTNIRNIKASQYLQLHVPIPALARQDDLVARLEAGEQAVARLQADLTTARQRGASLRRTLLTAAVAGRL